MWKIYLINKEGALEVITIVHGKTHHTSYKGCHMANCTWPIKQGGEKDNMNFDL